MSLFAKINWWRIWVLKGKSWIYKFSMTIRHTDCTLARCYKITYTYIHRFCIWFIVQFKYLNVYLIYNEFDYTHYFISTCRCAIRISIHIKPSQTPNSTGAPHSGYNIYCCLRANTQTIRSHIKCSALVSHIFSAIICIINAVSVEINIINY